jgi:hypothetical protein
MCFAHRTWLRPAQLIASPAHLNTIRQERPLTGVRGRSLFGDARISLRNVPIHVRSARRDDARAKMILTYMSWPQAQPAPCRPVNCRRLSRAKRMFTYASCPVRRGCSRMRPVPCEEDVHVCVLSPARSNIHVCVCCPLGAAVSPREACPLAVGVSLGRRPARRAVPAPRRGAARRCRCFEDSSLRLT